MSYVTEINEAEFIAFDLETTGLHPVTGHILELGAVRFRGDGVVLDEFHSLVNPGCPIPLESTRVHGIDDHMVASAPRLAEVLPCFLSFAEVRPAVLLAHNARFDVGFLSVALAQLRLVPPQQTVIDTCDFARKRMRLPNYRLETIGRCLGLIDLEKHRALDDAQLLKHVFCHFVRVPPALQTLAEILGLTKPVSFERKIAVRSPLPGYEVLWQAMESGFEVSIEYHGSRSSGAPRRITPKRIVEMNGVIYLSAYCHVDHYDKTFRLDRIGQCSV